MGKIRLIALIFAVLAFLAVSCEKPVLPQEPTEDPTEQPWTDPGTDPGTQPEAPNGSWTGDWASRYVTLAASSYVATTERTDYSTGLPNPLIWWNNSSRLLSNDLIDNENAVRVLRDEAASSGGLLNIDTNPHFILW